MVGQLTNEHYEALGRLAVSAARLESVVEHFTMDAITPDTAVAVRVLSGMTFDRQAALLIQVLEERLRQIPEEIARISTLVESARTTMRNRNRYLHGLWMVDHDEQSQVRNRARKTGLFEVQSVNAAKIRETADDAMNIADRLESEYLDLLIDLGVYEEFMPGVMRRTRPAATGLRSNRV